MKCGNRQDVSTSPPNDSSFDDDLDFIVTEAHEQPHELVGGVTPKAGDDNLGIQSTANLMEDEATFRSQEDSSPVELDSGEDSPIGDSTPPLPPVQDDSDEQLSVTPGHESPADQGLEATGKVQKLSDDEVSSIRQNLYREPDKAVSEIDKQNLLRKIDTVADRGMSQKETPKPVGFDNAPIVPPKKSSDRNKDKAPDGDKPTPMMAQRVNGIAFYWRNWIQITGEHELHEHDEVAINERCFSLRKKKISSKLLVGILIPIAAMLVFIIGTHFTQDATGGVGQIVGIVLDSSQKPFIQGATITLPEAGKSYRTNSQGFFRTEMLDAGIYEIKYVVEGQVAGTDYTTVVRDKITMVTLSPELIDNAEPTEQAEIAKKSETVRQKAPVQAVTANKPISKKSSQSARKRTTTKGSKSSTARLKLVANVDGARLSIDGSVVGAGNLTFTKLKPGSRKYSVMADGYRKVSGSIQLLAGKTIDLKITLEPLTEADKRASMTEKDLYLSAENAMKAGDYSTAIADLTDAVHTKPSYAAAFYLRAEANRQLQQKKAAHNDYVRAAEQYRFKKQSNNSITSYNHAIELIPKSIPALLGRASVYLSKGEEIAAIADYETVVKLDRRNAQAYYGLGEARFNQGYYKKAIKHFKDARSLEPESPRVYQYLMLSYLAANDVKKVRKTFERFRKFASQEDLNHLFSDKKYSAIVSVISDKE